MNKQGFIGYIASEHKCTKAKAKNAINMFTASLTSALSEGKDVILVGFGSFSVSMTKPRTGRNPSSGKEIQIPAKNIVRFRSGEKLKKACNK